MSSESEKESSTLGKYQKGEDVKVNFGGKWYNARVLQVLTRQEVGANHLSDMKKPGQTMDRLRKWNEDLLDENKRQDLLYCIHYQGWNIKWDEWVTEDRVMLSGGGNKVVKTIARKAKGKKGGKKKQATKKVSKKAVQDDIVDSSEEETAMESETAAEEDAAAADRVDLDLKEDSVSEVDLDLKEDSAGRVDLDLKEDPAEDASAAGVDLDLKEDAASGGVDLDLTEDTAAAGGVDVDFKEDAAISSGRVDVEENGADLQSQPMEAEEETLSDESDAEDNEPITTLKAILEFDSNQIKTRKMFLKTPAEVTVKNLFDDYVASVRSNEGKVEGDKANLYCLGLRDHLNAGFMSIVYKEEIAKLKQAFRDFECDLPFPRSAENMKINYFAAVYALRLITMIDNFFSKEIPKNDEEGTAVLTKEKQKLLKFTAENAEKYFPSSAYSYKTWLRTAQPSNMNA